MTKRERIDASREARQWIRLIVEGFGGAVALDYMINEGKYTKKAFQKIQDLKAKLSKKPEEENVVNYVNR